MPVIILKNPFIRHYAGSVFDVEESTNNPNWEYAEKISPKRTYFLPDNGRGYATELDISDTILCPNTLFEGVDLMTGPCRMTSAKASDLDSKWGENQVILSENKQELNITDLFQATRLSIFDRKTNQIIQEKTMSTPLMLSASSRLGVTVFLDFSAFSTGFYEIKIFCKNEILYTITFIKCFPLVITFDPKTGKYTTMKTIW